MTSKQLTRALREVRATYNLSLADAVALWRTWAPEARATWGRA